MSLDLYPRETAERLSSMPGVQHLPDTGPGWLFWATLAALALGVVAYALVRWFRWLRSRSIYRTPPPSQPS